jgi:hypothetical protein
LLAALAMLLVACNGARPEVERQSGAPAPRSLATAGTTPPPPGWNVLVGAGDVAACNPDGAALTAALLDSIPGTVFVAGDAAYGEKRGPNPFRTCYDETWGRHKARTRPTLGNHDYLTTTPATYFDYFGNAAGPRPGGYYSYDVGPWHVVALNTNIDTRHGSAQDRWLRDDLADHRGRCTVAVMHHPRFSSGPHGTADHDLIPLWETLEGGGVSVAISGHDHLYERFQPMRSDGTSDSVRGIRQFVAGTGGAGHYPVMQVVAGSEVRNADTYGVLALTLEPDRYRWAFVPVQGAVFRDSGAARCR